VSDQTLCRPTPEPLLAYLRELMEKRRIPGLQVAVVQDGEIEILDALGLANIEHEVPTGNESVFSLISMAKAFTGVALMQLAEAGQLDLSAPVADYLDGLPKPWRSVTVRQLATFSSGLPEIMTIDSDFSTGLVGGGSERAAWETTYATPVEFAPGQGYRYVQTNYALLGQIIGRLSGMAFTEFVAQRQFAAAGMTHTLYATDRDIIPGRANSYMNVSAGGDAVEAVSNSHMNYPRILRTAGGLYSTAKDLAAWIIALQDGAMLRQTTSFQTLTTPTPLHDGRAGVWGIGWNVGESRAGRIPAAVGGAKAQIALYPGGLTVILLANLIGAFPEQFAPISGNAVDLSPMDPIADHYAPN
jgi:CubicO group peptidase (beta-lactamase class C family)